MMLINDKEKKVFLVVLSDNRYTHMWKTTSN